ncbi:MAG TPA: phage BR0599 family protein [Pyrinomonadaceae bacterium]|jgi:uncharacterized phage protein (TIGR02218 family)
MTLDAQEVHPYRGTPQRLFLFQMEGIQWPYVAGDRPKVYNSIVYEPTMIEMPGISQALSEDSPTIEITMDANNAVALQFVPYQPIYPIRVRVYRHHVEDPDDQYVTELIGECVNAVFNMEEGTATINVRMFASNLDRRVPWPVYQKVCNYATYGPGCRVNPNLFKTETNVGAVDGDQITAQAFADKAAEKNDPKWYVGGLIKRMSTGEARFVVAQDGANLYVSAPFVDLKPGDAIMALAGDDRHKSTCEDKFNNLHRFFGFPWVPTKNPFVDNVYGTGSSGSGSGSNNTPDPRDYRVGAN